VFCVGGETQVKNLDHKALAGTPTTCRGFWFFMTDFSTTKFFCSRLSGLMSEVNGKSPFDHWQDACDLLVEEQAKYDAIPIEKREQKPSLAKLDKIAAVKLKIAELALTKDDDVLSERCKNQLLNLYGWTKYEKWIAREDAGDADISKLEKGALVENLSIEMLNRLDGTSYSKNEGKFTNEYLIGIPDIIDYENRVVVDVKSSWNIESFMQNVNKELNIDYWWQVQGYMAILGFDKAEVSFCLISTPEHILEPTIAKLAGDLYTADYVRKKLTVEDIPEQDRRLRFVVDRDEDAIQRIYKRLRKCREYLSIIEQLHLGMK
jgi:transcriptional regulator with XRE-family HTH domain